MKVLAVFALFVALAAAIPTPPEQSNAQDLLSADANTQADNAERAKRFIFKFFSFSPVVYSPPVVKTVVAPAPVVTPIVKTVKVVQPAPVVVQPAAVQYQVQPVVKHFTYSIPSYSVTKVVSPAVVAAPAVAVAPASVAIAAPGATVEVESAAKTNGNGNGSQDDEE